MGKRKYHNHDDDEALGDSEASAAASSSTKRNDDYFVSPPKKWERRELELIEGVEVGMNGSEHHSTYFNGYTPEKEVKKAIWLVRKPKNVRFNLLIVEY
jgi:hypothetical protein